MDKGAPETPETPQKPSRRAFLRVSVRAGLAWTALGGASALAIVRTSGYRVDPARAGKLRTLSPWQLAVVDAVALRMCAPDVAPDAPFAPPSPLEVGVGEFVDAFLTAASRPIRRDVSALIGVVEHAWPVACGHAHRFSTLAADAQDDVLAKMERSSIALIRGGFSALKNLVMMGYYRDARTWGLLGYDGPIVRRPSEGWVPLRYRVPGVGER